MLSRRGLPSRSAEAGSVLRLRGGKDRRLSMLACCMSVLESRRQMPRFGGASADGLGRVAQRQVHLCGGQDQHVAPGVAERVPPRGRRAGPCVPCWRNLGHYGSRTGAPTRSRSSASRLVSSRLRDGVDARLQRRPSLWIPLPGFVIGNGGRNDHVAQLPVDRRGDLMPGGELGYVDHPCHLVEIVRSMNSFNLRRGRLKITERWLLEEFRMVG